MADREKVIKGLHQHCEGSMFDRCGECPYYEIADEPFQCRDALLMDALFLLKEQEVVEPKRIDGKRNHFIKCGNCNCDLMTGFQFCPHCGRPVKWK